TFNRTVYPAPSGTLTLTAGSEDIGLTFTPGATPTDSAQNLVNAINRNGGTVGLRASAAAGVITLNSDAAFLQTGNVTLTETSAAFAWGAQTNGTAAAGVPTIFALNQLYPDTVANGGCQTATQAVPAAFWSYNTGTGAVADLSPALSFVD